MESRLQIEVPLPPAGTASPPSHFKDDQCPRIASSQNKHSCGFPGECVVFVLTVLLV